MPRLFINILVSGLFSTSNHVPSQSVDMSKWSKISQIERIKKAEEYFFLALICSNFVFVEFRFNLTSFLSTVLQYLSTNIRTPLACSICFYLFYFERCVNALLFVWLYLISSSDKLLKHGMCGMVVSFPIRLGAYCSIQFCIVISFVICVWSIHTI